MKNFQAFDYIKIDIANHFGLDKEVWENRINWVNTHSNTLEKINTASSPILYSKAVRAYRRVQQDEPINHSVSLDATASFLQIMSVLTRCEKSAKACNMIDTGKREDIYSVVMDYMNHVYSMQTIRQDIKDCLMPWAYGSIAAPKEVFGDNTPEYKAFIGTIKNRLPGAYTCMELMKASWNAKTKNHHWLRDDNVYISCPVIVKEKQRIRCGKSTFTHIANINKPTKKGISNLANFIQSIDALVCARMIERAREQGYTLYTIHDSFWCHPNYMQQTRENYLNIMIDLARKPILIDWFKQMTGLTLEEMPQKGINSFITQLKTSEYCLS